jgi:endonuclease III
MADTGRRTARIPAVSPELLARARTILPEVTSLLAQRYGSAPLGNRVDPLEELVFIQLSIRTREETYVNVFEALHAALEGDWEGLLHIEDEELLPVLHGGGMASVKLARLRGQLLRIVERFGAATLDPLHDWSDEAAEGFLRSLPGVGPKAARCVLLYSLGRQVFPVDSHCRRVLDRLGFLPAGTDRKAADDILQALVPGPISHDLHVNLVHHGRTLCVPGTPRCNVCPLLALCPTGRART